MMAQAVGATQFVEAGGAAAVHSAEVLALPGTFATAFGSAANQADQMPEASDHARLKPGELPGARSVQPAMVLAVRTAVPPSAPSAPMEAAMPPADAPKSKSGPGHLAPPEPAGEKLVAIPEVSLSAPVVTDKTVRMAVLPSAPPSLPVGKETVAGPKKTASAAGSIVSAKGEVKVVAPVLTALASVVELAPPSPEVSPSVVPAGAAITAIEAPGGRPLEVGDTAATAATGAPSTLDTGAAPSQEIPKQMVAEGTKQAAKTDLPTAASGLVAPRPVALSLAPVTSPVTATQAGSSTNAGNSPLPAVAPAAVVSAGAPASPTPTPALQTLTPSPHSATTALLGIGGPARAQALRAPGGAASEDAIAGKTAGAAKVDRVVASNSPAKTDSATGGALKPESSALAKPDPVVANTPGDIGIAVTSLVQATGVVPGALPLVAAASGHVSPAADLPLSVSVPEHNAGVGSLTGTSAGLPHTTISSSSTALEVGVASGTHGWLKIRAELSSAGEVNASLTGGTSSEANKLRGELPALSSYLQAEQVQVSGLSVHAAVHAAVVPAGAAALASFERSGSGGADTFSASTDGSSSGGSASGQSQHQAEPGATSVFLPGRVEDGAEGVPQRSSRTSGYGDGMGLGDGSRALPVEYGSGGGWLNVRV